MDSLFIKGHQFQQTNWQTVAIFDNVVLFVRQTHNDRHVIWLDPIGIGLRRMDHIQKADGLACIVIPGHAEWPGNAS